MAGYTSWVALENAIQKELKNTMNTIEHRSYNKALENAEEFYSQGSPKRYVRTGTYGDTPDSTGVSGGGNHYETDIYMNPNGHGYSTGTFSAYQVWEAVENSSYGVLGLPGRWNETESDIQKIINEEFGKRFSK